MCKKTCIFFNWAFILHTTIAGWARGKDEWPPSSPDLNPLDYGVWDKVARATPVPNIDTLCGAGMGGAGPGESAPHLQGIPAALGGAGHGAGGLPTCKVSPDPGANFFFYAPTKKIEKILTNLTLFKVYRNLWPTRYIYIHTVYICILTKSASIATLTCTIDGWDSGEKKHVFLIWNLEDRLRSPVPFCCLKRVLKWKES